MLPGLPFRFLYAGSLAAISVSVAVVIALQDWSLIAGVPPIPVFEMSHDSK